MSVLYTLKKALDFSANGRFNSFFINYLHICNTS